MASPAFQVHLPAIGKGQAAPNDVVDAPEIKGSPAAMILRNSAT